MAHLTVSLISSLIFGGFAVGLMVWLGCRSDV